MGHYDRRRLLFDKRSLQMRYLKTEKIRGDKEHGAEKQISPRKPREENNTRYQHFQANGASNKHQTRPQKTRGDGRDVATVV